uniref:Uncharacterized protein n=1 Tax=Heterorhabditis bacteriophora TaxID=37862 RepID=A0A1I7W774_HETBA
MTRYLSNTTTENKADILNTHGDTGLIWLCVTKQIYPLRLAISKVEMFSQVVEV